MHKKRRVVEKKSFILLILGLSLLIYSFSQLFLTEPFGISIILNPVGATFKILLLWYVTFFISAYLMLGSIPGFKKMYYLNTKYKLEITEFLQTSKNSVLVKSTDGLLYELSSFYNKGRNTHHALASIIHEKNKFPVKLEFVGVWDNIPWDKLPKACKSCIVKCAKTS